jgi:hypothetical protein
MLAGYATSLLAQPNENATVVHREKMKVFDAWVGKWEGTSTLQMGPGTPNPASVVENIQSKLDGTILLIEGIGKVKDEASDVLKIVHHAMAVLSYDRHRQEYKLKSYLNNGNSTDAWFKILDDHRYQWGFDAGNIKMRYSITLDPTAGTWAEIGEFSRDGGPWTKVFEMNLRKTM